MRELDIFFLRSMGLVTSIEQLLKLTTIIRRYIFFTFKRLVTPFEQLLKLTTIIRRYIFYVQKVNSNQLNNLYSPFLEGIFLDRFFFYVPSIEQLPKLTIRGDIFFTFKG